MRKFLGLLLVIALIGGGWYAFSRLDARVERDETGGLRAITIRPRGGSWAPFDGGEGSASSGGSSSSPAPVPAAGGRSNLRLAAYHTGGLEPRQLADQSTREALVTVARQFDVLALQQVGGTSPATMVSWVEALSEAGVSYGFAMCPVVRGAPREEYQAFLFNRATVEVDLDTVHSIEDPGRRFRHKPLVGLFRARGIKPEEAFTFKLVSLRIDSAYSARELQQLMPLYRAVRDDGLGEDDVILLGDFGVAGDRLEELCEGTPLSLALAGGAFTSRGVALGDNLLLSRRATKEFIGRGGAVDLRGKFGLSSETAYRLASHLPVWGEFTRAESDRPDFMAEQAGPQTRR